MGRDKALLVVEGVPLAARVAAVLTEAGCAPVVLSGNQTGLTALGWPVVSEPPGLHHPLRGVAAALARVGDALVVPCDLVGVEAAHLRLLLDAPGPCVAEVDGRVQPLLGRFPRSMAATALALAEDQAPARLWSQALPRVALPALAAVNVNRPEELAAWRARRR